MIKGSAARPAGALPMPRSGCGIKRVAENVAVSANKRRWSYRLLLDSFENSVEIVREPEQASDTSYLPLNKTSSSSIFAASSTLSKSVENSNIADALSDISVSSEHAVQGSNSLSDAFSIVNSKTGEEIKLKLSVFQGNVLSKYQLFVVSIFT